MGRSARVTRSGSCRICCRASQCAYISSSGCGACSNTRRSTRVRSPRLHGPAPDPRSGRLLQRRAAAHGAGRKDPGRGLPERGACGCDGQAAPRLAHIPAGAAAVTGRSIHGGSGGLRNNRVTPYPSRQAVRKGEATSKSFVRHPSIVARSCVASRLNGGASIALPHLIQKTLTARAGRSTRSVASPDAPPAVAPQVVSRGADRDKRRMDGAQRGLVDERSANDPGS